MGNAAAPVYDEFLALLADGAIAEKILAFTPSSAQAIEDGCEHVNPDEW